MIQRGVKSVKKNGFNNQEKQVPLKSNWKIILRLLRIITKTKCLNCKSSFCTQRKKTTNSLKLIKHINKKVKKSSWFILVQLKSWIQNKIEYLQNIKEYNSKLVEKKQFLTVNCHKYIITFLLLLYTICLFHTWKEFWNPKTKWN
jgi:hypothetical protein